MIDPADRTPIRFAMGEAAEQLARAAVVDALWVLVERTIEQGLTPQDIMKITEEVACGVIMTMTPRGTEEVTMGRFYLGVHGRVVARLVELGYTAKKMNQDSSRLWQPRPGDAAGPEIVGEPGARPAP